MTCHLHPGDQLIGDLFEDLLGEVTSGHALGKLDELDNITMAGLASRVSKTATIAIELLHLAKISTSDSDYDDRAGKAG